MVRRGRLGVGGRPGRAPPVRDPADRRQAASCVVRRIGGGVDHLPRVLPGRAPGRLSVRAHPLPSAPRTGAVRRPRRRAPPEPPGAGAPSDAPTCPCAGRRADPRGAWGSRAHHRASLRPSRQHEPVAPGVAVPATWDHAAVPPLRPVEPRLPRGATGLPGPGRAVHSMAPPGGWLGAALLRVRDALRGGRAAGGAGQPVAARRCRMRSRSPPPPRRAGPSAASGQGWVPAGPSSCWR